MHCIFAISVTNLNLFYPKIGRNWPKGFIQKILKFRRCILLWYPLGKTMALHLNKLLFPIYKDSFCHVWLKLAQWLWFIFHFITVFSLFRNHPFLKRVWYFSETDLNPFYMYLRMICAKFGWHWTSGFGEEVEKWKVYKQTE